jgi:hypothetical protein
MITADDFREVALDMQDAFEGAHMGHPDFRANGRIFASLHTGDKTGMVALLPEEQREFMKLKPAMFSPAAGAWGRGGSTIVTLAEADKKTLRAAMNLAWQRVTAMPPPRTRSPKKVAVRAVAAAPLGRKVVKKTSVTKRSVKKR